MLEKVNWESKKIPDAFSETSQSDHFPDDALIPGNIVVRVSDVALAAPTCGLAPSRR
jgi:hypothetical protein